MASSSQGVTLPATGGARTVEGAGASRTDESSPLIMEEGKGSAQATPTTPGKQVEQSLAGRSSTSAAAEDEDMETDRAELQRALENMPFVAVSEASLHEVDWNMLGWEYGVQLASSVTMVIVIFGIVWMTPPMPFKVYIMPLLCLLVFGLGVFLSELIYGYFQNPERGLCPSGDKLLQASPLLQAILGKKLVSLPNPSDVYIFAHALERHPQEAGAFVERVVNPANAQLPRKILTIGDDEIAPGRWKATGFKSANKDYTEELRQAADGELYPTLSQVVEGWIFKEPQLKMPCLVELTPPSRLWYFVHLWNHWAVRLLVHAMLLAFFLTPLVKYLNQMHKFKRAYCVNGIDMALPFCGADSEGKTCEASCDTLIHFISEVGARIGVEEVEFVWTACLAMVMIFVLTVYYIRSKHPLLEIKFIMGMGGIGRGAESEFLQVRSLLDDNLSFFGIVFGLFRQGNAYASRLKACEPLDGDFYNGAAKISNQCFWEVTREWRTSKTGKASCKPFSLPLSVQEHEREDIKGQAKDLVSWADKIQKGLQEFAAFKNFHGLTRKENEDAPQKDFKFCVSVPVTCRESLSLLKTEFFTSTGSTGYSRQLDAIFAAVDCQDEPPAAAGNQNQAGFCHVVEDFRLGPLLIPAGMCLTHIACQTHTGDILSLEIGKGKDIPNKESFLLLFHGKDNAELNNSLVLERFSEKYHWPSIMLPSAAVKTSVTKALSGLAKSAMLMPKDAPPVDSSGLTAKMKDAYVYQFYFVFQTSPSYFEAMRRTKKDSNATLYGFTEGIMTRLKDAPTPEPALKPDSQNWLDAVKKQSWRDAEGVQCCLVVEVDKNATLRKAITLMIHLLEIFGLVAICGFFVMIVPLFRHYRWGSEIFPSPFTGILASNAFIQFACLVAFLWLFTISSARLGWIGQALTKLEQRTLAPADVSSGTAKVAPTSASASKSTTFREPTTSDDPFQLYIAETKDYDPRDIKWVAKWQAKEKAILNWHLTTRYLRVFVSKCRLTGQAVLVAAAAILGGLLLVDIEQGLRGYGALSVNNQQVLQDLQDEAIARAQGKIQEKADAAGEYAKNLGEGLGNKVAGALGRRLLETAGSFDFATASQALVQALKPIDAAVERMHRRQLVDLGEDIKTIEKYVNVADVQHITQADLLTLAMSLLLIVYSIYLLAKIARINDKVDKHESILVQVKEQHLHKQSEREQLWAGAKASADLTTSDPGSQSVEQAQRSYERMLDMCIQSSHDNRGRFPLKLFSFIITQALLVAWLAAAAQPLVNQLHVVVPQLAADGCQWLSDSGVMQTVEGQIEGASAKFGKTFLNTDEAADHGDHSIVYSLVCTPILNAVNANVDILAGDMAAAKNETANAIAYGYNQTVDDNPTIDRRLLEEARARDEQLLSAPSVRRTIEEWWNAHPGDAASKTELVRMLIQERQRHVRQLFKAAPEAARRALQAGLGKRRKQQHQRSSRWLPGFQKPAPLGVEQGRALFE